MPFCLCNAPATFQRCMSAIFHGFCEKIVEVFMDDFSVYGNSFDNCLRNLDKVLQRCEETNLVLNWEKCHDARTQLTSPLGTPRGRCDAYSGKFSLSKKPRFIEPVGAKKHVEG